MTVLHSMREYAEAFDGRRCAAALGTFDGVHRGHAALIQRAIALAHGEGLPAVALTFDRHPLELTRPESAPRALMTEEEKLALFEKLGLDGVIVEPFTKAFAAQTPESYVRALCGALRPKYIVVGFNHRFGCHGEGDVRFLASMAGALDYEAVVMDPVCAGGEPISSTRIRTLLEKGDRGAAEDLAGHALTRSPMTDMINKQAERERDGG